jgi:hypothetical protein
MYLLQNKRLESHAGSTQTQQTVLPNMEVLQYLKLRFFFNHMSSFIRKHKQKRASYQYIYIVALQFQKKKDSRNY